MITVAVNFWAVLAAAVAGMAVGFVWYGWLFKKPWMDMMGITEESMKGMKMTANQAYAMQFIASLVMAYVLTHVIAMGMNAFDYMPVEAGLSAGFWSWLGFIAPVTLGVVLWENKPWKLWFINVSNYLVTLLVMGAILGYWM